MSQELLNSIIAKVAVHLPLMAKGMVENSLRKIGARPPNVTPGQLKRALDEHIIPTLKRTSGSRTHFGLLGGGFIYTGANNRVQRMSKGIYQYLTRKLPIDHEDFFGHLHELGLVNRVVDFGATKSTHDFRRITISRPFESILEVTSILLLDDANAPSGTISTIRDVTLTEHLINEISALYDQLQASFDQLKEKADLEEQLKQSQKMEAIGQLSGGIAHDFNNMIGVIAGFADLILRKYAQGNPTLETYAGRIKDTSLRAADLTAKLLAFSRKGKFTNTLLDIHTVVNDVVELSRHTMDRRIEITTHLNAHQSFVMADRTQLQNAVLNMALNAKDAMPNGGELIFATEVVTLDSRYVKSHQYVEGPGEYLLLSITDTGIGMDPATQARIFEPFFTTKLTGQGTGLGLASVYGTIRNHGGTVEVYSEPGKGTSFKVYLPFVPQEPVEKETRVPEIARGSGNVLLIDDDEAVQFMATEILSELGFTAHICDDGIQGRDYYRDHHNEIDLILLDLVMPKMDGSTCFAELIKINPQAKIVITSGYSANGEASDLMRSGAAGFLQKPFDVPRLSQALNEALKKHDAS